MSHTSPTFKHMPSDLAAPEAEHELAAKKPARNMRRGKTATRVAAAAESGEQERQRDTGTKTDLVLKKLRSTRGVTITALGEATGWQAHSVRGFLSAVVKKRMRLRLVSEIGRDGTRRYRTDAGEASS